MSANQGRRWHSAGWWASVGGIAGVVGTLIALIAYLFPLESANPPASSTLPTATGLPNSTGQPMSPSKPQGLPYSLDTAGLPREPVPVEDGGHVDQPFTAKTKRLDLLKVIIGRNDPDQGFEDDAPIGCVRFQILDEDRILHDQRVEARNNTATSIEVNLAVQPGEEYVLRVINEERNTQLGFYFTAEEREPYAIVHDGPGEAPYEYPHQLSATVRGYD